MDKPKNFKELKKRLQPFVNMDNQVRLNKESVVILLTILESGWE